MLGGEFSFTQCSLRTWWLTKVSFQGFQPGFLPREAA
jgi:hypothetical protein